MTKELKLSTLLASENPEVLLSDVKFEDGLRLMEELVQQVESGALPLDQAVQSYERGVELLKHLRGILGRAEQKLKVLKSDGGLEQD